jgi:mutator protein MutT
MKKGIDYIGVGCGAVILNAEGKVFLAKRGKEARNEKQKWEFPGGSVEFGENLEDTLIREIKEEYDFAIAVEELIDVVNHIIPQEKQHWVSPTFLCRYQSGTPRIMEPHKCEKIGWFDLNQLPEREMTIASAKSLESLRKKISGGSWSRQCGNVR